MLGASTGISVGIFVNAVLDMGVGRLIKVSLGPRFGTRVEVVSRYFSIINQGGQDNHWHLHSHSHPIHSIPLGVLWRRSSTRTLNFSCSLLFAQSCLTETCLSVNCRQVFLYI